jgi:cytochrome bd-type quinol oxidase subunit 1
MPASQAVTSAHEAAEARLHRIVIVGGSAAGLELATSLGDSLGRRGKAEVTLIVFPGLTIGLASYLAVLEGLWLRTGRQVYMDLYHFWSKVFAVAFGMGAVSGLVMAYHFGTNWRLYKSRVFLRFALLMTPSGLVALLAGWMATEIGRQPWVIYGLMRTADAASPVGAQQLGVSLALFVVVYFVVFGAGTGYLLKLIVKGPQVDEGQIPVSGGPSQPHSPARPLSAADDEARPRTVTVNAQGAAHGH